MSDTVFALIVTLGFIALVGGVFGTAYLAASYECHSKWKQSGFEYNYGLFQGCLIKPNGIWIPETNYREME